MVLTVATAEVAKVAGASARGCMLVLAAWTNVGAMARGSRQRCKQPELREGVLMAAVRVVQVSLDYFASRRPLEGERNIYR